MIRILLFALLCGQCLISNAQEFNFATYFGSPNTDISQDRSSIRDIATDDQGNVYYLGYFRNELIGEGDTTLLSVSTNFSTGYLMKRCPAGELLWVKIVGSGLQTSLTNSITVIDDQLYITGSYKNNGVSGNGNFGNGVNMPSFNLSPTPFLAAYDFEGEIQWGKSWEVAAGGGGSIVDLIQDHNGDLYLSGGFSLSIELDTDPGVFQEGSKGFILKTNNLGEEIWSKIIPSSIGVFTDGMVVDADNNLFIVGLNNIENGWDHIDPSISPNFTTFPGLIIKFNPDGDYMKHFRVDPEGGSLNLQQMKYDESTNTIVYLARSSIFGEDDFPDEQGPVNFYGALDDFPSYTLCKFNPELEPQWTNVYNSYLSDVEIDESGNIYIFGLSHRQTVGIGEGIFLDNPTFLQQAVYAKLDGNGEYISANILQAFNGASDINRAYLIGEDNFYVAGSFSRQLDFPGGVNMTLPVGFAAMRHQYIANFGAVAGSTNNACNTATSLSDLEASNVRISPNPTDGYLTIETEGQDLSKIEIFDLTGKRVFSSNGINTQLNLTNLPAGLYVIQAEVKGSGVIYKEKLVKQ